ncbi:phage portal protein [Aliivibrio fischeri]|uniref:phage portal protein n=1 Tax=Aliivibrio fischeri TaxID=668 RepID=UPI00080DCC3D|nr:phage portal protein [Aliivibrio fischeri]OCH31829.1 phage portal protein [Aliivibrio fischeri]
MSWIEKMISPISPSWALKRVKDRQELNARFAVMGYEAAEQGRTHQAKRQTQSANQSVAIGGVSLREQARKLDEDHDLVIGIFDKLEERVVGANGIMVEPQPRDANGEVLDELAKEIRRRWAAWSLRPEVTGTYTRPELERMLFRTAARDGEVFTQLVRGVVPGLTHPNPNGTPFSLEALEPDFVPFHMTEIAKRVIQGIEVNQWRQPLAYHVFYDHPSDSFGITAKTKRIPKENMLHLAHRKRLHQLRGITLLHGVIKRLADLKDYEESERVAARIAAALAFYIKKGTPDLYTPPSETKEGRQIPFGPGTCFDELQQGEEVGMIESNRPNTHLSEFRNGQIRMVASGTRGAYSSIARDYNGTYSAQRQELVEGWESFAVLQQWFVAQQSRPVYRAWLEVELLRSIDPLIIPAGIDKRTLFDAVYLAPVMPWIDPKKETDAWKERIKGGNATEAMWIRASGHNPEEVKRARVKEIEENRKQGLVFDTDPSNNQGVKTDEKPSPPVDDDE